MKLSWLRCGCALLRQQLGVRIKAAMLQPTDDLNLRASIPMPKGRTGTVRKTKARAKGALPKGHVPFVRAQKPSAAAATEAMSKDHEVIAAVGARAQKPSATATNADMSKGQS